MWHRNRAHIATHPQRQFLGFWAHIAPKPFVPLLGGHFCLTSLHPPPLLSAVNWLHKPGEGPEVRGKKRVRKAQSSFQSFGPRHQRLLRHTERVDGKHSLCVPCPPDVPECFQNVPSDKAVGRRQKRFLRLPGQEEGHACDPSRPGCMWQKEHDQQATGMLSSPGPDPLRSLGPGTLYQHPSIAMALPLTTESPHPRLG